MNEDQYNTTDPILNYPFSPGPLGTLPSAIAWAQKKRPVCPIRLPSGDKVWMVSRKEDVRAVMTDSRLSRNLTYQGAPRFLGEDFTAVQGGIFNLDPPDHTRVRRVIQNFYTKEAVESYKPAIHYHATHLLEKMSTSINPNDLISTYVNHLPLQVSCDILNISIEQREQYLSHFKSQTSFEVTPEEVSSATTAISNFATEIIRSKRNQLNQPGPIEALIIAQKAGTISEAEMHGTTCYLLVTGSEPLVAALGTGSVTLLVNKDQLSACISDPSLWPSAVEELLRYHHNGVLGLPRVAKEDVELNGTLIRKGEAVCATPLGATWDPRFYKKPSKFDIFRNADATPTFGFGPHFCIGAILTRAFLNIAYAELFKHFPTLNLAVAPEDIPYEKNIIFTKPAIIPVVW